VFPFQICDTKISTFLCVDCEAWLRTQLYDKRDDFNFPIVNCPSDSSW